MGAIQAAGVCRYLVIAFLTPQSWGFNIDPHPLVIQSGRPDTAFGYTVSQYLQNGVPRLLVGAPRAHSMEYVDEGGVVWVCHVDQQGACNPVDFNQTGAAIKYNGVQYVAIELKAHQRFGFSLSSSYTNSRGVVLACAPHYVYYSENLDKEEPVGSCIARIETGLSSRSKYFSPYKDLVDLKPKKDDFKATSKAMYGISSAVTKDGRRLLVGAVGSYTWQGQLYSHDIVNDVTIYTPPNTASNFTYLGYTVDVGQFTSDNIEDYVASIPRDNDLLGKVVVFTDQLEPHLNLSGMQMGEYFGYSIAVGDFNGDSLDDMAVGAPMHSYSRELYDAGCVYVHYQTATRTFSNDRDRIHGIRRAGARFGTSVASLGDISLDGYDDLAVGAPYDGSDHQGAVYIFHGSKKGIRLEMSQVIYGSDVEPSLQTFGFSLSGGIDMDNNDYPDLLVGAFKSDKAVALRARPIINIEASLTITPAVVDPEVTDCLKRDGSRASCLELSMYISYRGINNPRQIRLEVNLTLEMLKPNNPRIYIEGRNGEKQTSVTIQRTVRQGQRLTDEQRVFLKSGIRDKLTPLVFNLTYRMVTPRTPDPSIVQPVANYYQPTFVTKMIHIMKDCGMDEVCIPDLKITAEAATKEYLLGSRGVYLDVLIAIHNTGEDAFEAELIVTIPPGTNYVNVVNVQSATRVKRTDRGGNNDATRLTFEIGNPLPKGHQVTFTLRVTPTNITGFRDTAQFRFFLNSSNPENDATREDNNATVDIPVRPSLDIQLTGASEPEQVIYDPMEGDIKIGDPSTIGPRLIHRFQLINHGPSSVGNATVEIYWPSYLEDGADLLYLTATPRALQGDVDCTTMGVDPRRLVVYDINDGLSYYVDQHDTERKKWCRLIPFLMNAGQDEANNVNIDLDVDGGLSSFGREKDRRGRRSVAKNDTDIKDPSQKVLPKKSTKKLVCTSESVRCTVIQCVAKNIDADDTVLIQIVSRVWVRALSWRPFNNLIVSSTGVAVVNHVPYDLQLPTRPTSRSQINTSVVVAAVKENVIWIYTVSAVGGVVALGVIVVVLWKCGFFKRKKPEDAFEVSGADEADNNSNDGEE